jgi:hypothetical protein
MDVSSWLENAASFLIPALGLVLLCCAAGERPLKAREIGRFALAGFACDTALLVAAYCRLLALYPG